MTDGTFEYFYLCVLDEGCNEHAADWGGGHTGHCLELNTMRRAALKVAEHTRRLRLMEADISGVYTPPPPPVNFPIHRIGEG